jgi:hypothetical protein
LSEARMTDPAISRREGAITPTTPDFPIVGVIACFRHSS